MCSIDFQQRGQATDCQQKPSRAIHAALYKPSRTTAARPTACRSPPSTYTSASLSATRFLQPRARQHQTPTLTDTCPAGTDCRQPVAYHQEHPTSRHLQRGACITTANPRYSRGQQHAEAGHSSQHIAASSVCLHAARGSLNSYNQTDTHGIVWRGGLWSFWFLQRHKM